MKKIISIILLVWSSHAFSQSLPELPNYWDLVQQVKKAEDDVLSQIGYEKANKTIGYFHDKQKILTRKPTRQTEFSRQLLGETSSSQAVYQDFYWQDNVPQSSPFIAPIAKSRQQKIVPHLPYNNTLAIYETNGDLKNVFISKGEQRTVYSLQAQHIRSIAQQTPTSSQFNSYHDNGQPEYQLFRDTSTQTLSAWHKNGNKHLHISPTDTEVWFENGQLFHRKQGDTLEFWHANGQLAAKMMGNNPPEAFDEHGKPIDPNDTPKFMQELTRKVVDLIADTSKQILDKSQF